MSVILTYTVETSSYSSDEPRQTEISTTTDTLVLERKRIKSINLEFLISCSSLQKIELNINKIQTIDLSPLSSCVNLRVLRIENNPLQNIDLSPLQKGVDVITVDEEEDEEETDWETE